ncbi:MAG TPA: metalloregulator ArsR/SmtB family transcription factor [Anaerolineae bacterium]|nr:metalloregulator ArsR/SmtB family transcription factor [Anaerolineae bacterium]
MTTPQLFWDWGTAYDLFVSLAVLHQPGDFGVRGAWAAGVRARLPTAEREILEESLALGHVPFHWIYRLPEPKDALTALWALEQLPAEERLPALALAPGWPTEEMRAILAKVSASGTWDQGDLEVLEAAHLCTYPGKAGKKDDVSQEMAGMLGMWSRSEEFGEQYTRALSAYQEVFFAEEERRIQPALRAALSRAQELAGQLELLDLLEELSQGLRYDEWAGGPELVLAPSYWCTPLMYMGKVSTERDIRLFGARPADASLVPGELVPDAMVRTLKALSDPTRLRILQYLGEEPLTPAELSRRLRLRAPTVIHHLKTLRLAGLVQLTLGEDKEVKRYAARSGAVAAAFATLQGFLAKGQ